MNPGQSGHETSAGQTREMTGLCVFRHSDEALRVKMDSFAITTDGHGRGLGGYPLGPSCFHIPSESRRDMNGALSTKRDYECSQAVRGEFFSTGAEVNILIYVDGTMHKRLERLAKKNGKPVTDLVNQLLKRDLELLENLS